MMFPIVFQTIQIEDDRSFMESLYIKHERLMYQTAMMILHNTQDADDAVNNACLKLIPKIPKLRSLDSAALRQYIVKTQENTVKDMLRKRKRDHKWTMHADDDWMDVLAKEDTEDELSLYLSIDALRHALEALPPRAMDLMTWKYLDGLSDAEIAKLLQISMASVRVYLMRVRKQLTKIMKESMVDEKS